MASWCCSCLGSKEAENQVMPTGGPARQWNGEPSCLTAREGQGFKSAKHMTDGC